jgi:hypothetical protein
VVREDGTRFTLNPEELRDAEGRFQLSMSSSEGRMRLVIDAPGLTRALLDLEVKPGLEGTVTDREGRPLDTTVVLVALDTQPSHAPVRIARRDTAMRLRMSHEPDLASTGAGVG